VKWVAAHYAFDLAHYIDPIKDENTFERDDAEDREARNAALAKALHGLSVETGRLLCGIATALGENFESQQS
jgi:hypothetical protein